MIMIQWRLEDDGDEVNVECFDKGTKEKALIKHFWQEVFPYREDEPMPKSWPDLVEFGQ
jgi:hypothetical protein